MTDNGSMERGTHTNKRITDRIILCIYRHLPTSTPWVFRIIDVFFTVHVHLFLTMQTLIAPVFGEHPRNAIIVLFYSQYLPIITQYLNFLCLIKNYVGLLGKSITKFFFSFYSIFCKPKFYFKYLECDYIVLLA